MLPSSALPLYNRNYNTLDMPNKAQRAYTRDLMFTQINLFLLGLGIAIERAIV